MIREKMYVISWSVNIVLHMRYIAIKVGGPVLACTDYYTVAKQ